MSEALANEQIVNGLYVRHEYEMLSITPTSEYWAWYWEEKEQIAVCERLFAIGVAKFWARWYQLGKSKKHSEMLLDAGMVVGVAHDSGQFEAVNGYDHFMCILPVGVVPDETTIEQWKRKESK